MKTACLAAALALLSIALVPQASARKETVRRVEASKREDPRWFVVDVQLKRRFKRVITLDELRKHEARELDGMLLLKRGN